MIKLGKVGVSLTCDICGEETDGFLDFEEAVAHKKAMEWISEKYQGEWEEKCFQQNVIAMILTVVKSTTYSAWVMYTKL